jgi:hypothetical protein
LSLIYLIANKNIINPRDLGRVVRHFFIFSLFITAFQAVGNGMYPKACLKPDLHPIVAKFPPIPLSPKDTTLDENAIKAKVHYIAKDSIRLDLEDQKVYLYGDAVVEYEKTTMKAAYLEVNFKTHMVWAKGVMDSTRMLKGKPVVTEGDKSFTAVEMRYNYVSKKGKIYEITTQEGDGKILGEAVKKDSSSTYLIEDGRYSTCSLDEPHFAIHAKKLKVIANDKIVTGPAQLQVMGINTPLAVPFGLFPNKKGRASGIIIPTYGESANQGFFLQNGGYYFGINDNVDLALKGDIYSHGSYGLKLSSTYKVRYEYSGNINIAYARNIFENTTAYNTQMDNYLITWTHVQDSKSNPSSNFSANVNAATSKYNNYNSNIPTDYLSNTLQSNISWRKSFQGTPFNLSANIRHSQNTISKEVDLSLPDMVLTMNRITPFKGAEDVGDKWYQKIGFSGSLEGKNDLKTGDSTLFKAKTLTKFQNGLHGTIPISLSLRPHMKTKSRIINSLNFFSLTPNLTLNDNLYSSVTRERYYPTTTDSGRVVVDTVPHFRNAFDYTASAALSTKFYALYTYKHSMLKAIHHVITPTVSFVYKPDYGETRYGYYKNVQTTADGAYQSYSLFQNGIFGGPTKGLQEAMVFGLGNNLEAKLRPKGDTATQDRKMSILDNFNINTAYNYAAPHFRWSPITLSAQTGLPVFKQKINVSANSSFDPYLMGPDGTDIERYEINHNNRIGRLTNAGLSIGTSMHSKDKNAGKPKQSTKGSPEELEHINKHPEDYLDFNLRWSFSVNYVLSYSRVGTADLTSISPITDLPTRALINSSLNQTMRFNGDVNLTAKWKVGFTSGYDLVTNKLSYTNVTVHRDLHCWEMYFNWVPFGPRQSYSIDLKVKSAVLQDLKLSRKREWYDYTN